MKECGKVIGYCPTCFLELGEHELNGHCSRCNQLVFAENVVAEAQVEIARQSEKEYRQSHMSFTKDMNMKKHIAHKGIYG